MAQWVLFYKEMYSKPEEERPPDKIWEKLINYDIMLDDWLETQEWRKKQKITHRADNQQEVFQNY